MAQPPHRSTHPTQPHRLQPLTPLGIDHLAKDFITQAIKADGGVIPGYIHSDNGSPMIGKTVTELLADLSITPSRSRPHVSNDNPYSEAWNKTLKYAPVFPDQFGCLADARAFMDAFVNYYNTAHHHSGIGLHTPTSVHDGTWKDIDIRRQQILNQAHQANPARFRNGVCSAYFK